MSTEQQIAARLGQSAMALYMRLASLLDDVDDQGPRGSRSSIPTATALRQVIANLTCGTYHDFLSDRSMPKAELVEALRAVPPSIRIDALISHLISDVVAGRFDERDEDAAVWANAIAPSRPKPAPPPSPRRRLPLAVLGESAIGVLSLIEHAGGQMTRTELVKRSNLARAEVNKLVRALIAGGALEELGGKIGLVVVRSAL